LPKTGNSTAFSPLLIEVSGEDLSGLSNEAGGHRVQRIPPTEKRGRVHTSTVTVAILEGDEKRQVAPLTKKDVAISWFSGTGNGGQHRNKHQNSCRVTHLGTGLVEMRQGRSRTANLEDAMQALAIRVSQRSVTSQREAINGNRRAQIGSGMRGDKIRTYRFQDDRVFDSRTGKSAKCSQIMKGQFPLLW
jgi:peptide chain release factor 1